MLQDDLLSLRNKSIAVYFSINGLTVYLCYYIQRNSSYIELSDESRIDPVGEYFLSSFDLDLS